MNVKLHDFRKPPRLAGNLEDRLSIWLRGACQLAGQRAHRYLPFRLDFALTSVEVLPPEDALDRLPENIIGFRLALGESGFRSLFTWPKSLAMSLVAALLGDVSSESSEDRDQTVVEASLCDYLMQQLLANVLQETFPGQSNLSISVNGREPSPRWTRLFASLEYVLCSKLTITGPVGEHSLTWLVSPKGPLEQICQLVRGSHSPEASAAQQVEAVVRELPIEVVVSLGETEVSLTQLGALKPGDLLLLKRRVNEPLLGLVDGREKFTAWPGRVGSRQAVQVESLIG